MNARLVNRTVIKFISNFINVQVRELNPLLSLHKAEG